MCSNREPFNVSWVVAITVAVTDVLSEVSLSHKWEIVELKLRKQARERERKGER